MRSKTAEHIKRKSIPPHLETLSFSSCIIPAIKKVIAKIRNPVASFLITLTGQFPSMKRLITGNRKDMGTKKKETMIPRGPHQAKKASV